MDEGSFYLQKQVDYKWNFIKKIKINCLQADFEK